MNLYIFNNLFLLLFFLLLFTTRYSIINLNSYESFSIFAIFFGFFSYKCNINKKFPIILISGFLLLIFYHIFLNIYNNNYLLNPSQYRDYGLFILLSIPFLLLSKFENKNTYLIKYFYLYFFVLLSFITNSRSIIYFVLLLLSINILISRNRKKDIKYSFIISISSLITFLLLIDSNSYGDFINRLKFGITSPTRIDVLERNLANAVNLEPIIYNTHNVLFHIYIYLSKFLSIISLVAISIAFILNLFLIYKHKLQNNSRVVLLSFSLMYYLFLYCNLESTNLLIYFFTIGLYYGFIHDLFKEKFIVEKSY
jgi:hypothetical protein